MQSSEVLTPTPLVTPRLVSSQEDRIRKGKIARLKAMIAAGQYHPKSEDIARSLFVSPMVIRRR
jgi:hypothetical protein